MPVTFSSGQLGHQLARLEGATKLSSFKSNLVPAVAAGLLGTVVVVNQRRARPENKVKSVIRDVCVSAGVLGGLLAGLAFYKTGTASRIIRGLSKLLGREVPREHQALKNLPRQDIGDRIAELFKLDIREKGVKDFVKLESLALGSVLGGVGGGILADWLNKENLKKTVPQKVNEGIFQFLGNITFLTFSMLALATGGKVVGKQILKNGPRQKQMVSSVLENIQKLSASKDPLALVPKNVTKRVSVLLHQHGKNTEGFQKNMGAYLKRELGGTPHRSIDGFVQSLGDVFSWGSKKDVTHKVQRFYATQMQKDLSRLSKKLGNAKTLDDISDPSLRATVDKLATLKAEGKGEWFGMVAGLLTGLLGGIWTSNQVNETLSKAKGRSLFPTDDGFTPGGGWYLGKTRNPEGTPWWENILNIKNWPSMLYLAGARSLESVVVVMYAISGYFAGTSGTDYSSPPPADAKTLALYKKSAPINRNSHVF